MKLSTRWASGRRRWCRYISHFY